MYMYQYSSYAISNQMHFHSIRQGIKLKHTYLSQTSWKKNTLFSFKYYVL